MVVLIISKVFLSGAKPKRLFCYTNPKYLATHESYKDAVEIEDVNYILSVYRIYMV